MNIDNRYIYTESPTHGPDILIYTEDEVVEMFGERGSAQLAEGETIFHGGNLYTDMVAAARNRLEETLEG